MGNYFKAICQKTRGARFCCNPDVTLATSGRSNCYIATNQKKALFVERLTSRESTESREGIESIESRER